MGNFGFSVPALGNKFVDYRGPIIGDSFNWHWTRSLSQVKYIAMHHSAGPDTQTPDDIARFHVQSRGWGGVGYHFIVTKNGTVYYVGDLTTARANVADFNHLVIGICLVGSFMNGKQPTDAQIQSTHELCSQLLFRTPQLPGVDGWEDVIGHMRFKATACPGDSWDQWRRKVILGIDQSPQPPQDNNRAQMIRDLYQVVLGREVDQAGLNFYLQNNHSSDQIRKILVESSEHRSILDKAKNFKRAQTLAEEAKSKAAEAHNKIEEITRLG